MAAEVDAPRGASSLRPAMVKIYGFFHAFGMIDMSPFVVKVATWCRLVGVEHSLHGGDRNKAPKGKLPYVEVDGEVLCDSTHIVRRLSAKHRDLDEGLTDYERALSRAFQSMIEEHLYFVSLTLRWQDDRGWAVLQPEFAQYLKTQGVPGLLTGPLTRVVRGKVKDAARGQGMGRHSVAEIEAAGVELIDALATFLGEKPYALGDAPRTLDATLWAFLYSIHDSPFENAVKERLKSKANLVAYVERVRERYWSESKPAAEGEGAAATA